MKSDVVIVGGGISGLSLAFYSAKAGFKTTLLEKMTVLEDRSTLTGTLIITRIFGLNWELIPAIILIKTCWTLLTLAIFPIPLSHVRRFLSRFWLTSSLNQFFQRSIFSRLSNPFRIFFLSRKMG